MNYGEPKHQASFNSCFLLLDLYDVSRSRHLNDTGVNVSTESPPTRCHILVFVRESQSEPS